MMNIIKHGNGSREFAHFTCSNCGCEFEELVEKCYTSHRIKEYDRIFNPLIINCPDCNICCFSDRQYRKTVYFAAKDEENETVL